MRYLTDDEREQLLESCRARKRRLLAPRVELAILTRYRKAELMNLRWSDTDWQRSLVGDDGQRKTKNNQGHSVAVNGRAL